MERIPSGYLEVGKHYAVRAIKLLKNGIIAQIAGTSYTTFIHISKLSDKFVSDPADVISVGEMYIGICITGNHGEELTLKPSDMPETKRESAIEVKPDLDSMIEAAEKSLRDKQYKKKQNASNSRKKKNYNR